MKRYTVSEVIPENQLSFHHELTLEPAIATIKDWNVRYPQTNRCEICWLKNYYCYCSYFEEKKEKYKSIVSKYTQSQESTKNQNQNENETETESSDPIIQITIYYHYKEIGRSANTMHILEALCPSLCDSIILGDIEKESKLIERIIQSQIDQKNGNENYDRIAVLYPSTDSITIPNWLKSSSSSLSSSSSQSPSQSSQSKRMKVELIVLDGTYPQATRLMNHLKNMMNRYNEIVYQVISPPVIRLPVVKLDLGETGQCASMIIGVMKQPSGEKICSLQAVIMALEQSNVSTQLCQGLNEDLSNWLNHILTCKIKKGKSKIIIPLVGDVSGDPSFFKPIQAVASHLKKSTKIINMIDPELKTLNHNTPIYTQHSNIVNITVKRLVNLPTHFFRSNFCIQHTSKFSVLELSSDNNNNNNSNNNKKSDNNIHQKCCFLIEAHPNNIIQSTFPNNNNSNVLLYHCKCETNEKY